MDTQELKNSSDRIGQLYPVLVDYFGRIIDGEHRIKANENWMRVKLEHIKTEKELLIARIACNTIRRNTTSKEKSELLTKLGEICLNEGTPIGRVVYELMYQTGMSYRWVAKYLPKRFKDDRRAHASQKRKKFVACHATKSFTFKDPPKDVLKLYPYSNTNFISFIMKKSLFNELEKKAEKLEITVIDLLYNLILQVLHLD